MALTFRCLLAPFRNARGIGRRVFHVKHLRLLLWLTHMFDRACVRVCARSYALASLLICSSARAGSLAPACVCACVCVRDCVRARTHLRFCLCPCPRSFSVACSSGRCGRSRLLSVAGAFGESLSIGSRFVWSRSFVPVVFVFGLARSAVKRNDNPQVWYKARTLPGCYVKRLARRQGGEC